MIDRMTPQPPPLDLVFKALADSTRRLLLDRLREHNGQTLSELCDRLEMARQSATQHLDLLERAGLVVVVRRGRERLHYLNPVPIHDIEKLANVEARLGERQAQHRGTIPSRPSTVR